MDQNLRQALDYMVKQLAREMRGPQRVDILGNADRINRDNREVSEESVRSTVRSFEQITKASRSAIKNEQKRMDNFFKGLGRGASILDGFYHRVNKSNAVLEKSIKTQNDTFKNSARSMEAFTRSTYNNTEKLRRTTDKLDVIDEATKKLQTKAKEKLEIENRIKALTQDYLKKQVDLRQDAKKYGTEQERVYRAQLRLQKKLKNAKGDEAAEIEKAIEGLKEARKGIQELQKSGGMQAASEAFAELREAFKGIEGWEKSGDEHLEKIYDELKNAGGSDEEIIQNLDKIASAIEGAKVGYAAVEQRNANKLIELSEKRNRILEALGPQIVAGLADTSRREFSMLETRQQRMGTQSFALLPRAMAMGMSETDLLTMTDENRYLIRRLALAAGEEGEIAYMRGDFRREVQDLGKELGLIGADAMRGMLEIADSLRVVGVDANTETLRGMTAFLKDSQVSFGITQEQMVSAFRDMTEEGLMGIRFMNRVDSVEAMQEEIAARMHLGRLLNQDIETMKRREREMAARVTGDPAEVFRRSIMAGILASQQGFSREDQALIRRRFSGEDISDPELARRAMRLEVDLRTTAAQSRSSSVVGGNLLGAIVTHRMMEMTGIDIQEATLEAQRRLAGEDARTARSDEPARRLNEFSQALLRSKEMLRGITESSFSLLAASIFSSVTALAHLTFHAWAAGLSLGRLGMGPGRATGRMRGMGLPLTVGASALAVGGATMYMGRQSANAQFNAGMLSEVERDQAIREANYQGIGQMGGGMVGGAIGGRLAGAWAGAKVGAAAGTVVPGLGNLIGGTLGLIGGLMAGQMIGSALANFSSSRQQKQQTRKEIAAIASGGLAGGAYNAYERADGSLAIHRLIMGEEDTKVLDKDKAEQLRGWTEESNRLQTILDSDHAERMNRTARERMENRLAELQGKIVGLMGFEPTEREKARTDLFRLVEDIDRINAADRRALERSVYSPMGDIRYRRHMESNREERIAARDSLIDKISGMDHEALEFKFAGDSDKLIHILDSLRPHMEDNEKINEAVEKLILVLENIDSNTERSANAEEQSLSQLRKQLGMASEGYWKERRADIKSSVEEMSKARDIGDAFE